MKTKVVLSEKAQRISAVVAAVAVAGVLGIGGLTLTSGSASAVTKTTNPTTTKSTTVNKEETSTQVTPTPTPTPTTTPTATPNTGIFTGDGEFTKADGIIILTGGLATVLTGYIVIRNRKSIFRGRVKFDR